VPVVFDHEDHGQLPEHREVKRFVEGTLAHGAIAHVANAKGARLLIFFSKRNPRAKRDLTTNDAVSAKEVVLLVEDVHGASLALGYARCFSEKFGHNQFRVRS